MNPVERRYETNDKKAGSTGRAGFLLCIRKKLPVADSVGRTKGKKYEKVY